ncbi:MAG: hypothetical protein A3J69_00565 [Candidatus Levybacteria bacterium RIFCSPHIGHO2_02_FULL_42_12]|nr:MAG: hypothetical protein A2698_00285 [Candidatus Levybacteria bacterium RIFCSPHIGHO2_01_FULL_42_15]OGH30873.1 MAG: hypothetical protein A3J69_00565 [Candidatus Levybacteria bacterium RIFCSPHIGHO2_02_FULL_42_12]OGH42113.1 MAG: hypothetical protein A3B53_00875 [Candidatus Levybacteria bacterium RIFCSPLOWO2_01_FULL_42_15]
MKTLPFGLDIGAHSVKAVWLNRENNGFFLKSALTYPAPPRGMASESPVDQQEMAHVLRKIVSEGKITTPYVNIALPESQVYTRVIEMPVLSDKELASAIYWEAEQQIPVPLSTISIDWSVLRRPQDGQITEKMTVLLVGAPSSLLEKYQKIVSLAGFVINSIETEVLSVMRALIGTKQHPPSLVLNIGTQTTSLAIVREQIMIFTYSIPMGGSAISRAIASDFGVDISKADEYKKLYGIAPNAGGGRIGKATEPILLSIFTEVRKAIVFYAEKYKSESSIQQILLSGASAKLPWLDAFFAENAGIETVVANPWSVLLNKDQLPVEISGNGPDYTVAVGLAMRSYE